MTPPGTHLILIPSYNTGPRLLVTVQEALVHWQPVWVVIDGSTDGSDTPVRELAQREPHLRLLAREKNGGKGNAILTGLVAALAAGFTHVLTMDADGQHPPGHIEPFMQASQKNPAALIAGAPVFGPDAPAARAAMAASSALPWSILKRSVPPLPIPSLVFAFIPPHRSPVLCSPLMPPAATISIPKSPCVSSGPAYPSSIFPHPAAISPRDQRRCLALPLRPRQCQNGLASRPSAYATAGALARRPPRPPRRKKLNDSCAPKKFRPHRAARLRRPSASSGSRAWITRKKYPPMCSTLSRPPNARPNSPSCARSRANAPPASCSAPCAARATRPRPRALSPPR